MTHPFLEHLAAAGWPVKSEPRPLPRAGFAVPTAPAGDSDAARYAIRALELECIDVATSPEGTRNHNLNRAAFSIGQLVAAGHLDAQVALDGLRQAGLECGLDLPEIYGTLPRSLADGGQHPRQVALQPREEAGQAFTLDPAGTPPTAQPDGEMVPQESIFDRSVRHEVNQLRIRDEARRQWEAEKAGDLIATIPRPTSLTAFLEVPDTDAEYAVDQLLPVGGRAILAAQYKAGKTTFVANLLRALADGGRFLGQYDCGRPRRVALIDDELDERLLRRWLREQHIDNTDMVDVYPLKGRVASFNLLDDRIRDTWADRLDGVDFVILDCLRPVLDGAGLDENHDVGQFLNAFDALCADAGIDEQVVVHHMGHGAQRSRGDSRILDWPDATWKITREDIDDPASARYFSAFGRDVNVAEGLLKFDADTKRITFTGLSKKAGKGVPWVPHLIKYLDRCLEPPGFNELRAAMREITGSQDVAAAAIRCAEDDRIVTVQSGLGRTRSKNGYVLDRSHHAVVDVLGGLS